MTGPTGGGDRPDTRGQARAYQAAVEAVLAVIVAACIGYWVDGRLDSSPWGLIIGVVVGFAAMVLRLLRLGREVGLTPEADDASRHDR